MKSLELLAKGTVLQNPNDEEEEGEEINEEPLLKLIH